MKVKEGEQMGSIRPEVVALSERLVGHRRHFHKYPELSLEEFQTCECIVGELKRIGGDDIEIQRGRVECGWDTAVVAIITGTHEAGNSERERCIALRADMDGLPIQETNEGIEYKSLNPGKHHACGHDGHMAMLLVAAEVIFHNRDGFAGKVKLLFQPGEEGKGGAKLMLDAGVLEKPKVQQVYGIHLWNYLRQGVVGVKNGNLMAGSQMFEISITGKGGHGAAPQGTCDVVVAGAHLVTQLHTIVSRNVAPLESAVVTVGTFNAGYRNNIIADHGNLTGTIRGFDDKVLELLRSRIRQVCKGVEASFGVSTSITYSESYPPTRNLISDPVEKVRTAASKVVGSKNVVDPIPTMGAEDFSFFLNAIPGCFFFVGSAPNESTVGVLEPTCPSDHEHSAEEILDRPHHRSDFDIHEDSLLVGASIWVQLVEDILGKKNFVTESSLSKKRKVDS